MRAPINKIIDQSFVDGPGNRTAVFFQGCNYHCAYCHNPETIHLCNNCGKCVETCPVHALSLADGKVVWDEELCCKCDTCLKTCPHLSSPRVKWMTADEVFEHIKRNAPFIKGISTSGGECTLYKPFLIELFTKVRSIGLTALIDSNGSMDFEENKDLLDCCDGVMLDVKSTDIDEYHSLIGGDGTDILSKARYLASLGKLTEVRTVCSPDFQSKKTVSEVSSLLAEYQDKGDIHYRIISYRHFGVREPYRQTIKEPAHSWMSSLEMIARNNGMTHVTVV